ncbi:MAG: MarR family winged helix-turn-helix transcriptional regulator [Terriglobales bacterium]|jgi:MarR family 2-MHQ and catechol resistance regulon transcriptional repressor
MGHYTGNKKTAQALDAFVKLTRASNSVSAATSSSIAGAGLTTSQFAVLEVLYHAGPLCLTEIAHKILTTGGNLTLVVKNLEKRGLVQRRQSADDRRFFSLNLTPKGKNLIAEVFPKQAAEITRVIGALSTEEQAELARLSKKLGTAAAGVTDHRS